MNYQSRRVPVSLGPLAQKIYLTLVAEADPDGLVTHSSKQNLMDFSEAKRRDVDRSLILLEQHKLLRTVENGEIKTRSPWFQMLGPFRDDAQLAKRFYDEHHTRVRNLRALRARGATPTDLLTTTKATRPTIVIETIKEVEVKDKDAKEPRKENNFRQWRFTVRILDCALIKNCFARTYQNREPFVVGPTTKIDNHWMDIVEFEPTILALLRNLVLAAIADHDKTRHPTLHREDGTLQINA